MMRSYCTVIAALVVSSSALAGTSPQRQPDRGHPRDLVAERQHKCAGAGPVPHYPEVGEEHSKSCGSPTSSCKPGDPLDIQDEVLNELNSGFVSGTKAFDEVKPGILKIVEQIDKDPEAKDAYANGILAPLYPAYALARSDRESQLPDAEVDSWRSLESFLTHRRLCPTSGPLCSCPALLCEDNHVSTVLLTRIRSRRPFRSLLPLSSFPKLRTLVIGQNVFGPRAWTSLGNTQLPQLRSLELFLMKLNDAHFRELPRIAPRLKFLQVTVYYNMDHPQESDALPAEALEPLCQLHGLQALSIFGPFTGLPDCFGNLTELLKVDVRGCWLQHPLPRSFSRLQKLRSFIGFGQREHHCPEAGCVSSWDNRISNEEMPVFWCPAGGWSVPLSSVTIPEWSNIEKFWVDQNFLTGPVPHWIPQRWPRLRSLDLYSNRITGDIAENLLAMPQLFQVQLHDNLLSGKAPHAALFSSSLRFIDVSLNPALEGCWPLVVPTQSGTVTLAARSGIKRQRSCMGGKKKQRRGLEVAKEQESDAAATAVQIGGHGQPRTMLKIKARP